MTDKGSDWLIRGVKRKQLRKERRNALRKADKKLKKLGVEIRDTDYTPYDFCGSICPVCEEIINRQKAEIERLRESREHWRRIAEDFDRASREAEMVGEK